MLRFAYDQLRRRAVVVLYGRSVSDYGVKVLERCEKLRELQLVETSVTALSRDSKRLNG